MIILLSPSKGQDFEPNPFEKYSEPELLKDSIVLASILKKYSSQEIQKLMSVSENLAELNKQRYKDFNTPFDLANAKQAVLAFKGDVYLGLDATSFTAKDLDFAQQHLRILSGLYGSLRPLDLIQAYRLEMKTKLANAKGSNLYQFWGDKITEQINNDLSQLNSELVINLASNEYFKSIKVKNLNATVLNINFKDSKDGKTRVIAFFAKKARGLMARHIIKNRLTEQEKIKKAVLEGYKFHPKLSVENNWVFERKQP